jgi:hypothetical protein
MRSASCRRVALAVAALLLVPLAGCELKTVRIQLPGYGNGAIEGVWLWRLDDATGQYVRACRIDFRGRGFTSTGAETVTYVQQCDNGHPMGALVAKVARSPSDAATVTLDLEYARWENPGMYRASAFNSAGESPLSQVAEGL